LTSERRRKPFQLARGAMVRGTPKRAVRTQDEQGALVPTPNDRPEYHFSRLRPSADSTRLFSVCSIHGMTDRPASWRMPSPKQMEKLAATVAREPRRTPALGPGDTMPAEYWNSVLSDPLAGASPEPPVPSVRALRLSEIPKHILRVSCSRCVRIVEIQKADAVRLYGQAAVWKDVGQRLLDNTCQVRTGRHEEDGCWPSFE
jgi:hypothetical protein